MSLHDEYYAHSKEGCTPESGWQPLQEHLQGVAEKAGLYAALFGSEDWAKTAAWLHDFGKSDPAFQAYLLRENGLDDTGEFVPHVAEVTGEHGRDVHDHFQLVRTRRHGLLS